MNVFFGLSPLLAVGLGGLLLMLAEAFGSPAPGAGRNGQGEVVDAGAGRGAELGLIATVVLFAGAIFSAAVWLVGPENLPGLETVQPFLVIDRFSVFFSFVLCLSGGLVALLAGAYLPEHKIDRGEFFPLLVFSTVGAQALVASGDLLSLFVALETMSLGVYAMIGMRRASPRASEAALKYFLLGSFAAAILLFGGALLYGATGHTDLVGIGQSIRSLNGDELLGKAGLVLVGLALILVGLCFKVSAVPFHMWTPDAYEGAPTPTTGYMGALVKSAAFAVMLRVLLVAFGDPRLASWGSGWPPVVGGLAVTSMFVANFIAGRQESVKRMLAYSSIAHAGYAMVGIVAASRDAGAQSSVLFYMAGYALSTVGAFGALALAGRFGAEAVSYEDLAGLGRRHPAVALAFSFFLVSLAGVPPTAGFFGKFYVFKAAIDNELYWLAVLGLLNSVLGAYYYLKVLVYMYMREPKTGAAIARPMSSGYVSMALIIAAVFVLGIGVLPDRLIELASAAALH
ncbi:MAG TPA: NADH-quinone oxidoreductase subunit N [Polyangiaceae bacterium]|nr:NADH-quinone oxidoreductase subunit N [Polyangiaceae bacterium]